MYIIKKIVKMDLAVKMVVGVQVHSQNNEISQKYLHWLSLKGTSQKYVCSIP